MQIKTKFNILDRVYIIELQNGRWTVLPYFLNEDCTINEIIIRNEGVYYRTNLAIYSEKDCFWTEKEACVESDRRNYELEYHLTFNESFVKAVEKFLRENI